jgi:hypothetical protein
MATNTTVLIVVTALAALVLAGMLVGVAHKALADEYAARAREVDIDTQTIRGLPPATATTVHRTAAASLPN